MIRWDQVTFQDIVLLFGIGLAIILALRGRLTRQTVDQQVILIQTLQDRVEEAETENKRLKVQVDAYAKQVAYLEGIVTGKEQLLLLTTELSKHHEITQTEHATIRQDIARLRDRFLPLAERAKDA